jgi:carboxy-terminal domain RNA polymerase II polypeptide A small phosphatase
MSQGRQRLRGLSFRAEYQGAAAARRVPPGRVRAPSMSHETSRFCLPEQTLDDRDKIVLVLDLDETLVYAREGPLFARPGLDEFFEVASQKCEVVVWTAGLRAYAQAIIRMIDPRGIIKHCIYRHSKWFTGQAGYRKDLATLGRNIDKTIIIENTPDCIRGYQQNGILVEDYEGGERADNTIPALTDVVRQMTDVVTSGVMTVPQFISTCPLLTRGPVQTDVGDYINVFTLNVGLWKPSATKRVNRDLPTTPPQHQQQQQLQEHQSKAVTAGGGGAGSNYEGW